MCFRDSYWPGGILAEASQERKKDVKIRTRVAAKTKIFGSIPEELKRFLGLEVTMEGVCCVFDTFQYCSLNKRLLYVLCEGILELLFPDNKFNSIFHKIHAKPKVWWQLRWECFDITCCWCEKPAQALLMCYLSEKRCHRQERGVCQEHVDSVDALWTLYPSLS